MKKFKKNGGFTLIEMLIVVAIIAILIAVSIPLVNNALERARQATDAANARSAKAEAMILYLSESTNFVQNTIYAYDAAEGAIKAAGADITPYGKSNELSHVGQIVYVCMQDDIVYFRWNTPKATGMSNPKTDPSKWSSATGTVADAS